MSQFVRRFILVDDYHTIDLAKVANLRLANGEGNYKTIMMKNSDTGEEEIVIRLHKTKAFSRLKYLVQELNDYHFALIPSNK